MKKVFELIPLYSIFVLFYQVLNPFTLYQTTTHNYLDRSGLFFQKMSNIYIDLPHLLPSYIKVKGNEVYLPNIIFLLLAGFIIIFSSKKFDREITAHAGPILFLIIFVLFSLFPKVELYNPVKVRTDSGLKFILHGNRYPKKDIIKSAETEILESKRIVISTLKPVKKVNFFVAGETSEPDQIKMFDSKGKTAQKISKEIKNPVFTFNNPSFKRFRGRLYYSFFAETGAINSLPVILKIKPE